MRRVKGFTLIELLVVVAIIGALVAVLIPSLAAARKRARLVACATNHRTLICEYQRYDGEPGYPRADYVILRMDILGPPKILICPETRTRPDAGTGDVFVAWRLNYTYQGAPHPGISWIDCSYGFNDWFIYVYPLTPADTTSFAGVRFYNRRAPQNESTIPVFVDAITDQVSPVATDLIPPHPFSANPVIYPPLIQMSSFVNRRHGNVTNVAFWDGHVESVKLPDLWTLRWHRDWKRSDPYPVPADWNGFVGP